MYTLFVKCFLRILNVLLDEETLKYVHRNAEFRFLRNAYIFDLYLKTFIRDMKFESPTQLELTRFFPRFFTDVF